MTDNDVLAIKMLSKYTNVVLLIGKADTYTKQELVDMQEEVFHFANNFFQLILTTTFLG